MKKILSFLLSLVVLVSFCAPIGAAGTTAPTIPVYGVNLVGTSLQFTLNGQVVSSRALKNTNITLTKSKTGDLLVSYTEAGGKPASTTLGKQKKLALNGAIGTLKLDKSLTKDITVQVAKTANIKNMTVASASPVTVLGKVQSMSITSSSAAVTLAQGAVVPKITATSP